MFEHQRDAARPIFTAGLAVEVEATRAFDAQRAVMYPHYTVAGNRLLAAVMLPAASRGCARRPPGW